MRSCHLIARRRAGWLLVVLLGCASEEAAAPGEVWMEVGQGLDDYTPLEDGEPIEIVLGPQGGWHVDLAARFGGTAPDDHFIIYRIWDPERSGQIAYPIKAFVNSGTTTPCDEGYDQVGIRTVFAIDHPDEILGLPWLVEAELIVDEHVIVDAHRVVFVDAVP